MVKLAYSPLSKLASTDIMSNVYPNNMINPTLSEVLQSDPVKRLFNQPDLIIKTIPLTLQSDNAIWHKNNGINSTSKHTTASEISIFPVRTTDEEKEDANLLPSKIKHKKSEIALLPIEKKSCGHYQPCENIICDVTVQQYVDKDCVSPMLALSIEEDEINAPVEKHCRNKYCDALSIDHNRCRRVLIKLYRCDSSHMCDICGRTFKKSRISRIHHRNCKRKKVYVHNDVDRLHLLKERMRMRELQILEITKMKKRDYSDHNQVMETLWKNEELIIIPQKASSQPSVTITSVPSTQLTSTNTQPIIINSQIIKPANTFGSASDMVSSENTIIFSNTSCSENKIKSISQVRFPNLQQNPVQAQTQVPVSTSTPVLTLTIVPTSASATVSTPTSVPALALALAPNSTSASTSTSTLVPTLTLTLAPTPVSVPALTQISAPNVVTTSASTPIVPPNKSCIRLAVSPQTVQPMNNLSVSPSHMLTTTSVQPKTFLTPIRVVPIANLISPPSLLHRTQGIPKFCIVAENVTPVTTPNSPSDTVQPTLATVNTSITRENASKSLTHVPISKVRKSSKSKKKKKNFFCIYCSKNITTDWYFKVHVAKHKGEKLFFCNFCDESFSNNYDMKKHITNQHTDQKELACDKCNYTCMSLAAFKSHIQTHAISSLNKADVHSKKQKKIELFENKVNYKLIHNSHKRKVKRIKYEDTSNSQNKQHNKEKDNNKNLLAINRSSNAKTKGFNSFVSVKKIEPENFKQESPITSR